MSTTPSVKMDSSASETKIPPISTRDENKINLTSIVNYDDETSKDPITIDNQNVISSKNDANSTMIGSNIRQDDDDDDMESPNNIIDEDDDDDDEEEKKKIPTTNDYHDDDDDDIPITISKYDVFWDFNGSIGFVFGSSGFILSLYYPNNWLPYFRYGCIIWIWGCISYLIPIFIKVGKYYHHHRQHSHHPKQGTAAATATSTANSCCCCCSLSLGDIGCLLSMTLFIIGCILGGFFNDENQVLEYITAISYLFCFGSFALAIEPIYQACCYCVCKRHCFRVNNKSYLQHELDKNSDNNQREGDDDTNYGCCSLIMKLSSLDRVFELLAIASFCVAGIFSGFGPTNKALKVGMYYWGIGSIFCVGRSCILWYNRRQQQQQQQQQSSMLAKDEQQERRRRRVATTKKDIVEESTMELVEP